MKVSKFRSSKLAMALSTLSSLVSLVTIVTMTVICPAAYAQVETGVDNTAAHNSGDPLVKWCSDIIGTLNRSRAMADNSMRYGDYAQAQQLLLQGLQNAANTPGNPWNRKGPITGRAVQHVIDVSNAVIRGAQGATNGPRTVVYFLYRAYDFINNVAYNLDIPWYIPYRNCGGCAGSIDMSQFENQYISYVREEVQMVLDTLAQSGYQGFVTPVGAPRSFLEALQTTTMNAALDLRESLFATFHACTVQNLENLSSNLSCYLRTGSVYYNDPNAVNMSWREASDLIQNLGNRRSCGGYPR